MAIAALSNIVRNGVSAWPSAGAAARIPMYSSWIAAGGSTTITAVGSAAPTITGTATAAAWAATSIYTQARKVEFLVTVAAATAVAGFREAAALYTIGSTIAGIGGFQSYMSAAPATGGALASGRFFLGLSNSVAAPTDVEPSTIPNIVGIGWDSADLAVQVMHRGAGAVTKISTGMLVPTVDRNDIYELSMSSPAGTTQSVVVNLRNAATGATFNTTITTNLPTTSTPLARRGWASVGGVSSVVGVAFLESTINPIV